jgi:hypothetical protein
LLSGAENLHTPDEELVSDALSQWRLRPDDGQVYFLFFGYFSQRLDIVGFDIEVSGKLSRAGVTRSCIYFFNFGALSELPDEGMLSGPAPNNQYLYLPHPP